MHVELRDEACDDLVDGAMFYGEQSVVLDRYFLKCLEKTSRNSNRPAAFMNSTEVSTDRCLSVSLTRTTVWFLESLQTWSQSWIAVVIQQRSILDSDKSSHELKLPIASLLTPESTSATGLWPPFEFRG